MEFSPISWTNYIINFLTQLVFFRKSEPSFCICEGFPQGINSSDLCALLMIASQKSTNIILIQNNSIKAVKLNHKWASEVTFINKTTCSFSFTISGLSSKTCTRLFNSAQYVLLNAILCFSPFRLQLGFLLRTCKENVIIAASVHLNLFHYQNQPSRG